MGFLSAPSNFLAQWFYNIDSNILGLTILSMKNGRTRRRPARKTIQLGGVITLQVIASRRNPCCCSFFFPIRNYSCRFGLYVGSLLFKHILHDKCGSIQKGVGPLVNSKGLKTPTVRRTTLNNSGQSNLELAYFVRWSRREKRGWKQNRQRVGVFRALGQGEALGGTMSLQQSSLQVFITLGIRSDSRMHLFG